MSLKVSEKSCINFKIQSIYKNGVIYCLYFMENNLNSRKNIYEKIELLGINLFYEYSDLVRELKIMQHTLALSAGWHYLLDWAWVISNLGDPKGKTIIDAGGGIGLLQWYLAEKGAKVISVDRVNRKCIPYHLVNRFSVSGLTMEDEPLSLKEILNLKNRKAGFTARLKALARGIVGETRCSKYVSQKVNGNVKLYRHELRSLEAIPSDSIDIIVSISALEHNNTIDDVRIIVLELLRILRPGGIMLLTLPATDREDWFFQPANSWCFSEPTLRMLFDFSDDIPDNFYEYQTVFEGIKNSLELKKHMAWRYYFTPRSGMPWGKWDPRYTPVGILKSK